MMRGDLKLMFAAGGTGGHLFPATAVADACRRLAPDVEIRFVGARGKIEEEAIPRAGYEIDLLWIGGIDRGSILSNLRLPLQLISSLIRSWQIVSRERPDVLVCAGAFPSYPIGRVAALRKVPLVLMESNALPGLVTRRLARFAVEVHVAFQETKERLDNPNVFVSGNPIRDAFDKEIDPVEARRHFGLASDRPTLFAFGGSLGARSINQALRSIAPALEADGVQVIWQTGRSFEEPELQTQTCYRTTFLHEMEVAYAAADLVIARAGATTIAELRKLGKPSILVPLPTAADDHQTVNARSMEQEGAALMIPDDQLPEQLYGTVVALLNNPDELAEMSRYARSGHSGSAADRIAERVIAIAGGGARDHE